MNRSSPPADQLLLDFDGTAEPARELTPEQFLDALRRRRARGVEAVRFKKNKTRIIALSTDGRTLHVHVCFRGAGEDILDAVAVFLKAKRTSAAFRVAIVQLRDFWTDKAQSGGWAVEDDETVIEAVRRLPSSGTSEQVAFLREVYARFNILHFGGLLPEAFSFRISEKMETRFGHMRYHVMCTGERVVLELAVNQNLFLQGNERNLLDTVLHEMTHVEAWLLYGEKGHGTTWRRVARRVGCEPRACSNRIIRRRRRNAPPLTRVPDWSWLPQIPQQGVA